jgi:hypothetical protein
MWNRIIKWQADKNITALPNYVNLADMNFGEGVDPIYKKTYIDIYNRVLAYQESHDGVMPEIIGIEGPYIGDSSQPTGEGTVQRRLENGLGRFGSFTEFWQKIFGRGYSYYYNDVYTLDQEIQRLLGCASLNCIDSMQLCYSLGTEMGYEVRYVQVQCQSGGHIRGQIKGHEFGDWIKIDPAAAISVNSQYPIGQIWCDYDNAHLTSDDWLVYDDGQ